MRILCTALIFAFTLTLLPGASQAAPPPVRQQNKQPSNSAKLSAKTQADTLQKRISPLAAKNKFDEMRQLYLRSIIQNPDNKYIWFNFAEFEEQQFEIEKALEYTDKALAIDPKYFGALVLKSRCLLAMNKTADGLKLAKQAELLNPKDVGPIEVQANAYFAMQNYKEAASAYKRLINLDKFDGLYPHNLSLCLMKAGQLEEAEACARGVVKRGFNPKYRATQRLAEILLARGKLKEAEETARLAIKQMPDILPGQLLLIKILRQEKKFDLAKLEENKLQSMQEDVKVDTLLGRD